MTRLFVCAGEASGDRLAADLLRELVARDSRLSVRGICGPALRERGVDPIADIREVEAVGVIEAIRKVRSIVSVAQRVIGVLDHWKPDLVLTVDNPGLNLWLARRARARGLRVVQWVSPQVWAWRPGRTRTVARSVDALLCLFPMEPALYDGLGLDVAFTGHPAVDRARRVPGVREGLGDGPIVGLAPGSREREVRALWPVFVEVAALVRARVPGVRFVVPIAPTVDRAWLEGLDFEAYGDLTLAGSAADVFLACSGTATLELAALGTPMVVVYRVHPVTYAIARVVVRGVRHLALPNILAGREIVPERVQRLDPDELAGLIVGLLGDKGAVQRAELRAVVEPLGGGASKRAADQVVRQIAIAKAGR